ncbi:flagellar motor protein MotB [Marinobacterium jannaschii]|uniref:flagellar motor protein MotB n=1 Tax=Marinobacterium jannaschii TaxID=64970 RepID=UPI0004859D69|nr:flagellar motor protein MotB [Marinobacterium jannaschii]
MPRREPPTDYVREDRWVLSYADFVTLLFAFFVVMYSLSSVNEEKYRELSDALNSAFIGLGGGDRLGLESPDRMAEEMITGDSGSPVSLKPLVAAPDAEKTRELLTLRQKMESAFPHLVDEGGVRLKSNELWLAIELNSSLLFESGDALPTIAADQLLEKIAAILQGHGNPIHVEGFTDNRSISTDQFPSNWELSAARAAAVVRLLALNGVDPIRLAAVGYGEHQPAYSNRTESGRSLNRRVVIVVSRDEKVRRALSAFGSEQISKDAVSGVIAELNQSENTGAIEQVQKPGGGVLYRQMAPIDQSRVQE